MSASGQRHCPYCGRWRKFSVDFCNRAYCRGRHLAYVVALTDALDRAVRQLAA